jgi:hypothetical protein
MGEGTKPAYPKSLLHTKGGNRMERQEFFNAIKDGYFEDLTTDFVGLMEMINGALPVFGTLATEVTEKEDGGKKITFIDVDEAQFVVTPEGVNVDDINTDMSTTLMTLHLDKNHVIRIVEGHGFHMFTPANKKHVLFVSSLIGKEVTFES